MPNNAGSFAASGGEMPSSAASVGAILSTLRSRASIGVAWTADLHTTPENLIRAADAAMYESKRTGVGRPVLADLVV